MIFYAPDIIDSMQYELKEAEAAHAVRVLRLKLGDKVNLIDGRGSFYTGLIVEAHHKSCKIEIVDIQRQYGKRPYSLHIGIAPTKNIDRFEWFIEKATEIGIDEITPLICERSERKNINAERLQRVMIAAIKQSQKAYLPQLNEIAVFDEWIKTQTISQRFIAHCYDIEGERQMLTKVYKHAMDAVIAIGPEGDFSMTEIKMALDCGFRGISLGNSRLRTETAGVVACYGASN